jgi:N-acetyl-anhydromuramyl-L-alanine amidase AmpD
MREITHIVVHCSATHPLQDIGAEDIEQWHKKRGWRTIGYHAVIRRDGAMEDGRPIEDKGAHVKGHNANSIGICVVGGVNQGGQPDFNFTRDQMFTLEALIDSYKDEFPHATVCGHRDFEGVDKACPCFDVGAWYSVK